MRLVDLTGRRYGRLVVLYRDEDYVTPKGKKYVQWHCLCDCGNETTVQGNNLNSGKTQSCGCLKLESLRQDRNKKGNTYDLSGEYGIGFDCDGNDFYFDLEDYEKIKEYTWHINSNGYVESWEIGLMHILVMGDTNKEQQIDHIHGNKTRNDNRKSNLRIVDYSKNAMNVGIRSNNTSGVTGVLYSKQDNVWRAFISVNKKKIWLGRYKNFKDAVKSRKEAEEKYYGKYSYSYSQGVEHE